MGATPEDLKPFDSGTVGKRIQRLEGMSGKLAKTWGAEMAEMFPTLGVSESKVSRWKDGVGLTSVALGAIAAYFAEVLLVPRDRILLFMFSEVEFSFMRGLVESDSQPTEARGEGPNQTHRHP